jgi:hypothetical protein
MISAMLAKAAAGIGGMAFTALGARLALKVANKMNWEPIFAAVEAAGAAISKLGDAKFNAPFWEPIETFLEEKVDVIWARFKKGLDIDEKQEEAPK